MGTLLTQTSVSSKLQFLSILGCVFSLRKPFNKHLQFFSLWALGSRTKVPQA